MNSSDARRDISPYDGIESFEYIDMSRKELGFKGIIHVLEDTADDTIIKHINLSYNANLDEVKIPQNVVNFLKELRVGFFSSIASNFFMTPFFLSLFSTALSLQFWHAYSSRSWWKSPV